MPTRFDALKLSDGEDSNLSSPLDLGMHHVAGAKGGNISVARGVDVPSYEDLSSVRTDEETVLSAVYGHDFSRENGVWGCARLNVHVRPPDTQIENVGSELTLSVQLGKKYPYVAPGIELRNVKGLTQDERNTLSDLLKTRADECAHAGNVMMCELVQVAEDFLLTHNKDPARKMMSAWEQMKEREAEAEKKQRIAAKISEDRVKASTGAYDGYGGHSKREDFPSADGGLDWHAANNGNAEREAEKELARQKDALKSAAERRKRASSFAAGEWDGAELDDESVNDYLDDVDLDDDYYDGDVAPFGAAASRYKGDFVELGLLGRGGGGEVVKVRNRLDKRLYAVKKIPLEQEKHMSGKIQNRKLLREVTTISRMMHKNIVRYYQAWVEGGGRVDEEQGLTSSSIEETGDDTDSSGHGDFGSFSDDSDESDSSNRWWTKSPIMEPTKKECIGDKDSDDNMSDLVGNVAASVPDESPLYLRERSTTGFLEQHFHIDTNNPLMLGVGKDAYDEFARKTKTSAEQYLSTFDDDSSVKVKDGEQKILYIQMEYCTANLRALIDESTVSGMEENERFRLIRQIIEALNYIHKRGIIHRDLKPGNVFLDAPRNVRNLSGPTKDMFFDVRLGDFGLATTHRARPNAEVNHQEEENSDVIDRKQNFESTHSNSRMSRTSSTESLTGGVGTTFYRAPEQEAAGLVPKPQGETPYGTQADIFSLGIVVFELFHPAFDTYFERADVLTTLRGDTRLPLCGDIAERTTCDTEPTQASGPKCFDPVSVASGECWKEEAQRRFPADFIRTTPENAQRLILWCLQRSPSKRPNTEELLASPLIPRLLELEQKYLTEALHCLSTPSSTSSQQIIGALFNRPTPHHVEAVYDTDVALKYLNAGENRATPLDCLRKSLEDMGLTHLDHNEPFSSKSMSSNIALTAAASTFKHAKYAGKGGREGALRGAPQRTAAVLALNSAASAAITGETGANPRFVGALVEKLRTIFEAHGAVHLKSPLLRPRLTYPTQDANAVGGPAEVIDKNGTVLLLPEDLTANFARTVGRGGSAASSVKRYDIDKVYHQSFAGGHPRESHEASFDIIHDDPYAKASILEAESIMVLCQVMAMKLLSSGIKIDGAAWAACKSPIWFLRLTHTRLADAILDICAVPPKDTARRACYHLLTCYSAFSPGPSLFVSSDTSHDTSSAASRFLDVAVDRHGLPRTSAKRLKCFLSPGCLPLPSNIDDALKSLQEGVRRLRCIDSGSKITARRAKRYEDVGKGLSSLSQLVVAMKCLGVEALVDSGKDRDFVAQDQISYPLFLCLDLGLRQRRRTIHGHLFYQAILLPDSFFNCDSTENIAVLCGNSGCGNKIAEGGRYDDLARKFRPPGNFGSVHFNQYTAAPFPLCVGLKISVGKLVERSYSLASLNSISNSSSSAGGIDALREGIGQPLLSMHPVCCIIASMNGLDAASLEERATVASKLWCAGIAAEYMCQSGVLASFLRKGGADYSSALSSVSARNADQIIASMQLNLRSLQSLPAAAFLIGLDS
uniref:non-specific serine/threonine protein kinase n=2 Tax=Odontella aurita TaxID=265563 RepID=A0A6U6FXU5_9STRA|mmetsp:Transcript_3860/g.10514  ORF Transcript_3860/g.10514 Transcript_3860/m.10514 type:complete len:1528 (+) Transcript_3860:138-4721(+)